MAVKMTESRKKLYRIISAGLMAALVWAGNYLQIPIPNGILITRIHLGNSMCLLAGLLFGSVSGGLASGIGAGLYDLLNPTYILSAPFTFVSKFAMGMTAGLLRRHDDKKRTVSAAVCGQLVYIVLYLLKSYFTVIIVGGTHEAALIAAGTNAVTSTVNAVLAVIISVPLYYSLRAALRSTGIGVLIAEAEAPKEKKTRFGPVTAALAALSAAAILVFTINLSASGKVKAAQAEKEKEYAYSTEVSESGEII